MSQAMVHVEDVAMVHAGVEPVRVLASAAMTVRAGERVTIVGRSGSGKSTLLHLVAGLDRPTSGRIQVGDVAVHELTPRRSARWRAVNVGIVFQFFQLLPTLTLLENVVLPMELAGRDTRRGRVQRAGELLAAVGLEAELGRRPAEVSGGQQQRAAVARALANDPPLILADEPTGNLDEGSARDVERLVLEATGPTRTVVLVTHDQALASRTGRVLELRHGRLQ